jgi:hypothetical protein
MASITITSITLNPASISCTISTTTPIVPASIWLRSGCRIIPRFSALKLILVSGNILQLTVSLKPSAWHGVQIDFGKFQTSAGIESAETLSGWNYSRSILFVYAQLNYHFGPLSRPAAEAPPVWRQRATTWDHQGRQRVSATVAGRVRQPCDRVSWKGLCLAEVKSQPWCTRRSANHVLGPHGRDSTLRQWGLHLASRGGKKSRNRAIVAVARKLTVLLHRVWVTQEPYIPFYAVAA